MDIYSRIYTYITRDEYTYITSDEYTYITRHFLTFEACVLIRRRLLHSKCWKNGTQAEKKNELHDD